MNAELRMATTRQANRNLARSATWVAIAFLALLAFGYAARAMKVELPEVYEAEPVHETAQ